VGLNSKAPRDIYGPGGISNLGRVFSPKRVNCYVAHDHEQEWSVKTPGTKQKWATKGRTFVKANRSVKATYLMFKNAGMTSVDQYPLWMAPRCDIILSFKA